MKLVELGRQFHGGDTLFKRLISAQASDSEAKHPPWSRSRFRIRPFRRSDHAISYDHRGMPGSSGSGAAHVEGGNIERPAVPGEDIRRQSRPRLSVTAGLLSTIGAPNDVAQVGDVVHIYESALDRI